MLQERRAMQAADRFRGSAADRHRLSPPRKAGELMRFDQTDGQEQVALEYPAMELGRHRIRESRGCRRHRTQIAIH
jgi:hypothetical protein